MKSTEQNCTMHHKRRKLAHKRASKKSMMALHKQIDKARRKQNLEPLKYHLVGYPETVRFTLKEIL